MVIILENSFMFPKKKNSKTYLVIKKKGMFKNNTLHIKIIFKIYIKT